MLETGTRIFFSAPATSGNRVLYPAEVMQISHNLYAYTAEFEEVKKDGFGIEDKQEMLIYYEIDGEFVQQSVQIVTIRQAQTKWLADFTTIGTPTLAERRQHYRVSTLMFDLTVKIASDNNCPLVDVSATGFSIASTDSYDIGKVVDVALSYENKQYLGIARFRNCRKLADGRIRYGLYAIGNKNPDNNLIEGLEHITSSVQRKQLQRALVTNTG